MLRFGSMLATAALLLSADVSGVIRLRPPADERVEFPPSENLPVLPKMSPDLSSASDQDQAAQQSAPDIKPGKSKDEPLQPDSRLEMVRFISGEFVRVVQPIPAGKKGFHMKPGLPLDEKKLRRAPGTTGLAHKPRD